MTAETYTANNREGQTWLVADNPYPEHIESKWSTTGRMVNPEWIQFRRDHPAILLTDHLPDGTKVRGDEIDVKWQYYSTASKIWLNDHDHELSESLFTPTRQIATLKHPDSYREMEVVEDSKLYTEAEVRQIAIAFYLYWKISSSCNIESAFDEWFAKQKLDKQN